MYKYLTGFALFVSSMASAQVKDWQTGVIMDNMLFPSYILAHAGWDDNEDDTLQVDGQPFYLINQDGTSQIAVELDLDRRADIKIELLPSEINTYSVYQGKLEKGSYGVYPKINYKYDFMRSRTQPGPVNLVFVLSVNGQKVGQKTQTISLRSVSECPFYVADEENEQEEDLGYMFAAYVNEDDPRIDEFLKEALKTGIVSSFAGYQGTEAEVISQVAAIWAAMGHRGIRYSSITNTSSSSQSVLSQRVRSLNDVLKNSQANCVDGSVFLCSVLKAIDLHTFLVKVPGHCYMGLYLDDKKTKPYYIETTAIGDAGLASLKAGSEQARKQAMTSLREAGAVAKKDYLAHAKEFNKDDSEYIRIDIDEAREIVKPIGH
ncbi:hypothetical protein GK091_24320 [Spirosoma agri]|uniref:Transglutaminase domain-containing protein n=1 Tax=Spirosoma agri TaxID=1987381 RepID=A0A6M0IP51_9BACT|nr:hypothetical protein [Spirosoma agri]NEU70028.1 hypothetical protein [Spirosoma agri]